MEDNNTSINGYTNTIIDVKIFHLIIIVTILLLFTKFSIDAIILIAIILYLI